MNNVFEMVGVVIVGIVMTVLSLAPVVLALVIAGWILGIGS